MDEQARHRPEQPDPAPAARSTRMYEARMIVCHGHIAVVAGAKEVSGRRTTRRSSALTSATCSADGRRLRPGA